MRMPSVTFSYDGIDFEKEDGHDERIKVHFVDMRDSEARIKAFADLKQKQCFDGGSRQRSNSQKLSSGKGPDDGQGNGSTKKSVQRQTLFDIVKSLGVPMGVNAFARSSSGGRREKVKIRLIACGGDGTVKWVLSELKKRQLLHLGIAIVPLGTGNDLSRVLGWSGSPPKHLATIGALRKHIHSVACARVQPFDQWDITVHVDAKNGGKFVAAGKKSDKEMEPSGETASTRYLVHNMINYFSIGADAAIVFAFEKRRKKTTIGNKAVYASQGIKQHIPGFRRGT